MKYFIRRVGKAEQGPFSGRQLIEFAANGSLDGERDFIRENHKNSWHRANEIRGLFSPSKRMKIASPDTQSEKSPTSPTRNGKALAQESRGHNSVSNWLNVSLPEPIVQRPVQVQDGHSLPIDDRRIDVDDIRFLAASTQCTVQYETVRFTATGKLKARPTYIAVLQQPFLNLTKRISKTDQRELQSAVQKQIDAWEHREVKERTQHELDRFAGLAERLTSQAQQNIAIVRDLLKTVSKQRLGINWHDYQDDRKPAAFEFSPPPSKPTSPIQPAEPRRKTLHSLMPHLWEKACEEYRLANAQWRQQIEALEKQHLARAEEWKQRREVALRSYEKRVGGFKMAQQHYREVVREFRDELRRGNPKAIVEYVCESFRYLSQPSLFYVEHRVACDPETKSIAVELSIPAPEDFQSIDSYSFNKSQKRLTCVPLKTADKNTLYDMAVKQAIIRAMYVAVRLTEADHITHVVVNGWVTAVNKATGNAQTYPVISVSAPREKIETLELTRLDPDECIKSLKGVVSGPPSNISPVKPILTFNREDSRFIASEEVLGQMNVAVNLAEMDWQEFEHLVRELFEKEFSQEGGEVKVTQSSNDGGVDAIAFDPDPIRGGKFVIQAKRYTNTVPVAAVRELYGTMINEGASKGILVTTSGFGPDSREFAKDKPLTLIGSEELLYLLEKHGHHCRIDVVEAKAKAREQGTVTFKNRPRF